MKNCVKLHFIREYQDDNNTQYETIEEFFIGGALRYLEGSVMYERDGHIYTLDQADTVFIDFNNPITVSNVEETYLSRYIKNNSLDSTEFGILVYIHTTTDSTQIGFSNVQPTEGLVIDWGDGSISDNGTLSHAYASAGDYVCRVYKSNEYINNLDIFDSDTTGIGNVLEVACSSRVFYIGNMTHCTSLTSLFFYGRIRFGSGSMFQNVNNIKNMVLYSSQAPEFPGQSINIIESCRILVPYDSYTSYRQVFETYSPNLVNQLTTITSDYVNILPIYDAQSLKQNLECRCSIIRGELDYNVRLGIPLKTQLDEKRLAILTIINQTPGVESSIVRSTKIVNKKFTMDVEIISNFGTFVVSFS